MKDATSLLDLLKSIIGYAADWLLSEFSYAIGSWQSLYSHGQETWKTHGGSRGERVLKLARDHTTHGASVKLCITSTLHHTQAGNPYKVFPSMEACTVIPWVTVVLLILICSYLLPFAFRLLLRFLRLALRRSWGELRRDWKFLSGLAGAPQRNDSDNSQSGQDESTNQSEALQNGSAHTLKAEVDDAPRRSPRKKK